MKAIAPILVILVSLCSVANADQANLKNNGGISTGAKVCVPSYYYGDNRDLSTIGVVFSSPSNKYSTLFGRSVLNQEIQIFVDGNYRIVEVPVADLSFFKPSNSQRVTVISDMDSLIYYSTYLQETKLIGECYQRGADGELQNSKHLVVDKNSLRPVDSFPMWSAAIVKTLKTKNNIRPGDTVSFKLNYATEVVYEVVSTGRDINGVSEWLEVRGKFKNKWLRVSERTVKVSKAN